MVLDGSIPVKGEDEEAEYESDPEEAALPLTMRRREASDDEEGEGDGREREKLSRMDRRSVIDSDGESDGEGGAPGYDDEVESELEEEELEEVEEYGYERRASERDNNDVDEVEVPAIMLESGGALPGSGDESLELAGKDQVEGEKKENEPFAVPTAGAFYMHDDRFRENGGGRHR